MALQLFKTLWGFTGDFSQACRQAVQDGFDGIEGQAPTDAAGRQQAIENLQQYKLKYIAEICTAGSYVPDRRASLQQHLDSLERQLTHCLELKPQFISCLGGCDAWPETQSLIFFERAIALAKRYGTTISFETHRGRSLFNPWTTARLCQQIESMKLTCDFSHWCVVTESLLTDLDDYLATIFPRAFHIHARIGYDQGPQVSEPRAAIYRQALQAHQNWWQQISLQHINAGCDTTMTPEFGPDGYQTVDALSGKPLGDLREINRWMANQQREAYAQFTHSQLNPA